MYQDPQNEVHSRSPAHVTNPNLSRPALLWGKPHYQGTLTAITIPQLGFSYLILPLRRAPTCFVKNLQCPNQLGPVSLLPLLTAHETALAPRPSGRVLSPPVVGHCTPSTQGSSSLRSRTSNSLLNCLSCHWTCPRSTVLAVNWDGKHCTRNRLSRKALAFGFRWAMSDTSTQRPFEDNTVS